MLKKLFVTAAAAAAVSVPFAGVAWADQPDDPGSNSHGVGAGGIPSVIGGEEGPFPPGTGSEERDIDGISDFAQQPGVSLPDAIHRAFPDTDRTPGGAIKRQTPGCGNGGGPKGTDFSICE